VRAVFGHVGQLSATSEDVKSDRCESVGGSGGAVARYLEGRTVNVAQGDYYLREGDRVEAPGRWVLGPHGAAAIGVDDRSGAVDAARVAGRGSPRVVCD
jgi:hypothetical protein